VQSPELAAALVLAGRIREKKLKGPFSLADVYRHQWEMLGNRDRVEKAVQVLIDCNWLRPQTSEHEKRAGYGTYPYGTRFRINPRIFEK
jgi:hypothetical protein